MEFRDWILERLTPAVMVISSPEAESMCQEKNGLTVVDLLRPYGFLHQLSGERVKAFDGQSISIALPVMKIVAIFGTPYALLTENHFCLIGQDGEL